MNVIIGIALIFALGWAVFLTQRVRRHEEVIAMLLEDLTAQGLTHQQAEIARGQP